MAIDAHLAELVEKHQALEVEIEQELGRPFSDSLKLSELKRQKLKLKDEIEKLRDTTNQVA